MSYRIIELERRLSNLVRLGNVTQVDYPKARVRVDIGGNTTAWLPWISQRAGNDKVWHPPDIGEQVVIISPSGELAAGVVLPGGIYKQDRPANGDKATISRTTYEDGTVSEYDRELHVHSLKIPTKGTAVVRVGDSASTEITESQITHQFNGGGKIEITADGVKITSGDTSLNIVSGGIIIKGAITLTGSLTQFKGALKSNGIALHNHTHGGVTAGSGVSGPPVPL
jgi:phage baseplate assembly protein V